MKIIKKIFNKILFAIIVAFVFAFINRCNVKAAEKNILLTIPGTDIEVAFSVDTDEYPYYYGTMRASNYEGIYKVDFYYTAEQLYYVSDQSSYCGLDSGYEENPCYGHLTKSTSTVPVYHYYKYYNLDNGHLSSANNEPETVSRSSMFGYFTLATYNFSDFVEYASSFGGYNSYGFPLINDYDIPWILSNDIYNNNDDLILTSSYVNELLPPDLVANIDFVTIASSDNSQEQYGNDLTITSMAVAIKYSPCNNNEYNYYYDLIPSGDTQHVMDWKQVNNDKCIGSYNVTQNGTLVGLITDKQGNQLYVKNFGISKIGTLSTFSVNNNKFSTFLTDLSSNINYGGPISGIIAIPINFMSTLYNSFSGTCSAYNLGSILGHNIVINCFTLESILGSTITGVIDMLCAFGIYYHLILLIISIYRKVMNLDELDDYLPQHMYHPKHGSYEDYNS